MLGAWATRIACLFGIHRWVRHGHYHYILNDTGTHAYQCERCGRVREKNSPM
ncbi:hypothetical protein BCO37747_04749 [Burkholderia contaminans]|jgi:hypothetical protein|nr:hypothetical protein BCO37747_04749 [Burkholderia contaminans]